jgi:TRAP transporter TAXI family solute receptor
MGRQKIRQLTLRAWSFLILGILVVITFLSWMSYRFLQPFPPKTLIMLTGMEGGSFAAYGELYRQVLARDGIHVVLQTTSGAVENLRLLKDTRKVAEAGFIQGTVGNIEESSNLVSLGGLAYTPLWIFYRAKGIYDDLADLKGKRIGIGPEGSAVRRYSLELLRLAGVTGPPAQFFDLPYAEAREALVEGKVDAVMMFGSTDNGLVGDLLRAEDVKLMSLSQAEAYTRRFPDLSHVVLPRGVVDPGRRYPPSDVQLLSPTTNLIVRKDLHPALVYLLLKASVEIHGGNTWVNKAGEFPTLTKQDDPISEQARQFYKSGGSWLYAYLPFWAATFAERLILIMIPLGVIIVPLIGLAPWVYSWRNRSKYYPLYRELRKLEREILEERPIADIEAYQASLDRDIEAYQASLDRIDRDVGHIRTSVAFYDELFILKEHIQIVRLKLDSLRQSAVREDRRPRS